MQLSTQTIISFPYHPEAKLSIHPKFNPELEITFPKKGLFKSSQFKNIKDQKIIGIWSVDDDFGEEICALELENGYFLTKGPMSPIGTGNADLFLFESKKDIKKRYEEDIQKIF